MAAMNVAPTDELVLGDKAMACSGEIQAPPQTDLQFSIPTSLPEKILAVSLQDQVLPSPGVQLAAVSGIASDVKVKQQQPVCVICKKTFKNTRTLKTHMLGHQSMRPYACNYCPRSFSQKRVLDEHLCSHTGIKCDVCSKIFAQRCTLNRHMKFHKGSGDEGAVKSEKSVDDDEDNDEMSEPNETSEIGDASTENNITDSEEIQEDIKSL